MEKPARKKVLILCTGNSCRSQIAEALINARLGESWQAWSAGTDPAETIHKLAMAVLKEIGVRHSGRPKSIAELQNMDFDLVITVCDEAAKNCPTWLGKGKREHIGFPDPAQAAGSEVEQLAFFRSVRDDIIRKVIGYLENYPV